MSEQSATDFIEKIKSDTNLQGELQGLAGELLSGNGGDLWQKVIDFAKTKGFDFIKPELEKVLGGTDLSALLGQSGLLDGLEKHLGGIDLSGALGGLFKK
jgi:hypothetical protein